MKLSSVGRRVVVVVTRRAEEPSDNMSKLKRPAAAALVVGLAIAIEKETSGKQTEKQCKKKWSSDTTIMFGVERVEEQPLRRKSIATSSKSQ